MDFIYCARLVVGFITKRVMFKNHPMESGPLDTQMSDGPHGKRQPSPCQRDCTATRWYNPSWLRG
jgi:hypothetical protein